MEELQTMNVLRNFNVFLQGQLDSGLLSAEKSFSPDLPTLTLLFNSIQQLSDVILSLAKSHEQCLEISSMKELQLLGSGVLKVTLVPGFSHSSTLQS